ncbi:DNRLRE domain-containing protein [Streptomyces sp. BPTC-684]|uniref:DNRLRE domain-containing protein n=1 Tax=Streptomyces sp. BPTC-684 TaxID=3043734 RepID=UPI0024B19494|nr:DNRLRE domain-containing protein [Streptomyces sp. BPTC-684]WHM37291.1 DNRLRE domain-containing protein [Streptomyces sp. BPTC-684]
MSLRRGRSRSVAAGGISTLTALALLGAAAPAVADEGGPEGAATPAELLDAVRAKNPVGPPVKEAVAADSALLAAQVYGHRVEVLDRRTETSTTWANPEGTLTTTLSGGPVRMMRDGKWVDVDATLNRRADGAVEAEAHPGGLRLAGPGGARARSAKAAAQAPASAARDLITLGAGSRKIGVQWKGGLPAPVLDGPRATYPNAVPGADLVVDATRTGFEQYLNLKERPADGAAPMTLPLRIPGLTATQQADGSVAFTDCESGERVATMPAPVMWDAQVDELGWPGDHSGTTKRTARSFITWETGQFADALVTDAKLALYNYHSWSCEKRGWEVWAADPADTGSRWTKQPALKQKMATSTETRSTACGNAGRVSADVTELAKTWASAKAATGSVALKAADESDTYAWKRFYSSEATEDKIPQLTVTFNYRPKTGTNLQAGTPFYSEGGVYKVNSLTPTLRFTTQDVNEDDEVQGTFEVKDKATGEVVALFNSPFVRSGSTASAKVPAGKLATGRAYTFRTTTYDRQHYANGWSDPVTFTVDTAWKPGAAIDAFGAANAALEAADVAPATTSTSDFAAIAEAATGTVTVPWDANGRIEVKPDDIAAVGIGSGARKQRGVNVNGSVVHADAASPVDTVVQPTPEGGSRTLQIIKNAQAPREYRVPVDLPPGAKLRQEPDGSVVIVPANPDEPVAPINAPWAKDATGKPVPTSYRVEGDTLIQLVSFDATTAFPVVADPWWNPFSWNWKRIGKKVKSAAKKCGVGALAAYVPVQSHHVSVNIQRARAGLRMVKFAGGPWGYVSVAVAGCLMGQLS